MVDWNPSHHTSHAWADAKTIWGKLGLVVFYSLIWLSIIAAAVAVVWPASQGADCFMTRVAGEDETFRTTLETMIRSLNIMWIGFMSYADVGGLKIKNTALVAVFVTAAALSAIPIATIAIDVGCMGAHYWQLWVYPVWAVLALILTVLEYKVADHGSAAENQNLV